LIVVVGAGIVGLVSAWTLQQAGYEVLVVARELGQSSRVPVALLNPVRGKRGSVAFEATEALQALWGFYPRWLEVHRGILRPVPQQLRSGWEAKLAKLGSINHSWNEEGLYLKDAAWLYTAPLLEGLAKQLSVQIALVKHIEPGKLLLEDSVLKAQCIVYAAGASGAHLAGLGGRFTPGSVLITRDHFAIAKSYGVYAAGNCLGGSYLPHQSQYVPHSIQPAEINWLQDQGQQLLGYRPQYSGTWSGVRYRLDQDYLKPTAYGAALTGFGSAAFFYAPLYAQKLLEYIQHAV
jgi:glycine/D-amino acid oxidase-like deaminating enzyme